MADLLASLQAALADRYTIERELGRGGMATVYLAQDRKHHRFVAIKVLKPELAGALGPERFLREVAIAAPLNHPHILPLLDSGEAAGFLYYVMPYVEGESLRDRLTRERQLPLEETLQITREVADGLSYAHSHGVVHRDIKPENILLESGHAVVSDFGIARAVSAAGGARLTETGIAVGTPAYMSPEQCAGSGELDGRSDLYSLGCVLYEMLAGEPPYTGRVPQAILAKKLNEPLPRISVVREVPAGVEAALAKALARTPADRWVTAAQFAAVLAHPEALAKPSGGMQAARRALAVLARRPLVAAAGVVIALAVVALVASQLLKPKLLNITISDITPVTSEPGVEFQPAISPDGKEVVYVAHPGALGVRVPLYVRSTVNVVNGAAVPLGDTSGTSWFPTWSPDGDFVRFISCGKSDCAWSETGKLGGAVRRLQLPQRAMTAGVNIAWSPDGARVAFAIEDTIFATSTADTGVRRVAVHTVEAPDIHSLAWSPDGKWIAYVNGNSWWLTVSNLAQSTIWIVNADGGEPHQVKTGGYFNVSPAWLDASHLLFVSNRDGPRGLYVVEVGPNGPRGEPHAIPGVADPHSISYSPSARKLAYAKYTVRRNIWSYPLGRSAPISIRAGRPVTTGNQVIETHDVSPDGKWIVYTSNLQGKSDLYKMPLAGGEAVPLAAIPGDEFNPVWSPDGNEIAFDTRTISGQTDIMVRPSEEGAPVRLTNGRRRNENPSWSPSGREIAFMSSRIGDRSLRGDRLRLSLLSRDSVGASWHEAVQLTDSQCWLPVWAPDGRGVVCVTSDTSWALVSPQGRVLWRRSTRLHVGDNSRPTFSRDGRTIYQAAVHQDGRYGVWAVPVARGEERLVVAFDDAALSSLGFLSVGPDRLYLTVWQDESDIWVMNLHW